MLTAKRNILSTRDMYILYLSVVPLQLQFKGPVLTGVLVPLLVEDMDRSHEIGEIHTLAL